MATSDIATALDYADALAAARKVKNWLVFLLLFMVISELTLFFLFRYQVDLHPAAQSARVSPADLLKYLIGLIEFLGVVLPIILAVDLLLIINIMLVGRLIGVGRVISAFFWCIVMAALLFPWQAFLANATFGSPDFKIPGVLYTWDELMAHGRWEDQAYTAVGFLRWARFVVFPLLTVVILLTIQLKSSRGLRLAQGDATPDGI